MGREDPCGRARNASTSLCDAFITPSTSSSVDEIELNKGLFKFGSEDLTKAQATAKIIPASLQKRISKTKICIYNLSGRCTRGPRCSFAHSMQELREPPDLYKTRLCIAFTSTGRCVKGPICRFAHGDEDLRSTPEFYKTSLCPCWKAGKKYGCVAGDKCRWAHGLHEVRQRGFSVESDIIKVNGTQGAEMALNGRKTSTVATTSFVPPPPPPGDSGGRSSLFKSALLPPPPQTPPPPQQLTPSPPPPPAVHDTWSSDIINGWIASSSIQSLKGEDLLRGENATSVVELQEIEKRLEFLRERRRIMMQHEGVLRDNNATMIDPVKRTNNGPRHVSFDLSHCSGKSKHDLPNNNNNNFSKVDNKLAAASDWHASWSLMGGLNKKNLLVEPHKELLSRPRRQLSSHNSDNTPKRDASTTRAGSVSSSMFATSMESLSNSNNVVVPTPSFNTEALPKVQNETFRKASELLFFPEYGRKWMDDLPDQHNSLIQQICRQL